MNEVKTVYIDSDSLLYRAAHLTNHKDTDLEEALAIAEDGDDDIALDTAEENDTLEDMTRIFHSMVNEMMDAVFVDAKAKGYKVDPQPKYVIARKSVV